VAQSKYLPKGEEYFPNEGEIWGEAKGENHGFRGRPSRQLDGGKHPSKCK